MAFVRAAPMQAERAATDPHRPSEGEAGLAVPAGVNAVLGEAGRPLDQAARAFMEPRFGHNFGDIRVHTDAHAAASAEAVGARAYTVGRQIVFGDGAYRPDSAEGRRLLAHELAHSVQQGSRARLLQRQPQATPFDLPYKLFRSPGGTIYQSATQEYFLSAWDIAHLERVGGFYLIRASQIALVTPPEIRQAARGQPYSVLLPIDEADVARLRQPDPAAHVRDLARRRLGVTVGALTAAGGPDQDFSVPEVPAAARQALAQPPVDVAAADRQGVEQARQQAAGMRQERTLELLRDRGEAPALRELGWSDRMDPGTLAEMSDAERAAWYVGRLGALQAQLFVSAQRHRLPMQLLAVVILNELADINVLDLIQSGPGTASGSLGIAQIQVSTAQRDRLVDVSEADAAEGLRLAGLRQGGGGPLSRSEIAQGMQYRTAQLLQAPQVAVEAAAREIEQLLTRMGQNQSRPWQSQHGLTASGPCGDAIYGQISGATQQQREENLAEMITAAYNSPDIVITQTLSLYSNATIHGANARSRARDLYRFRLFRTQ